MCHGYLAPFLTPCTLNVSQSGINPAAPWWSPTDRVGICETSVPSAKTASGPISPAEFDLRRILVFGETWRTHRQNNQSALTHRGSVMWNRSHGFVIGKASEACKALQVAIAAKNHKGPKDLIREDSPITRYTPVLSNRAHIHI